MKPGSIETQNFTRTIPRRDWADAISLWLDSCKSANTRRSYAQGLQDFLASTTAMPWDVNHTDVIRYSRGLEKAGKAPSTINQRVSAVSSFYDFVTKEYLVRDPGGKQVPLHDYNPATGKSLRSTVELYGKATFLDPSESRALLDAIYRGTTQGYRDYALFLGYLMLSRRNSEWRLARWGDFEQSNGQIIYRWRGKGKQDQRLEVPAPVYQAVCAYIEKAGRLETIQPFDYIFTPVHRGNKPMPGGKRVNPDQPISGEEVGRLLKRYLKLAGLHAKGIRPHSLRHSGAVLMQEAGATDREIMEFLGHKNLSITQVYLHNLRGNHNSHWMTVGELLGISPDPSSQKRGKNTDQSNVRR
ncbi:tyrosine recombinase XerD [Leptolinea sp. HRD-7]|nr:tyrosine recombinase XerD [Leptolinea sp. HRD-7]